MKRAVSILLSVLLLAGLCACGGKSASPAATQAPAPTEVPAAPAATDSPAPIQSESVSYADAYLRYRAICTAVQDEVSRRLESHNGELEKSDPANYFMNSAYLILVYQPFHTAAPAVGSALAEASLESAQTLMRSYWPDAVLTQTVENIYRADYTYTDPPEIGGATHSCVCTWEFDPAVGSFRVTGYTDGLVSEFTEFIPQGNSTYLLYTMADKALVTYEDGAVTELYHAHMINEPALGDFAGDVRLSSLMDYDFFPGVVADKRWITEETNARYIITLRDGAMTYSGKIAGQVSEDGLSMEWVDAGTITLREP